ncbi:MAG: hypothetical protein CVU64_08495 [Deltaproteobacteria bacterium HGW-Deltaproteobacteria-21]|nr:MAG: hypothetical protein CVU64_08495 [Deltaproteobacteria bacterium HGW-Deltaproteobacteria-21]
MARAVNETFQQLFRFDGASQGKAGAANSSKKIIGDRVQISRAQYTVSTLFIRGSNIRKLQSEHFQVLDKPFVPIKVSTRKRVDPDDSKIGFRIPTGRQDPPGQEPSPATGVAFTRNPATGENLYIAAQMNMAVFEGQNPCCEIAVIKAQLGGLQ